VRSDRIESSSKLTFASLYSYRPCLVGAGWKPWGVESSDHTNSRPSLPLVPQSPLSSSTLRNPRSKNECVQLREIHPSVNSIHLLHVSPSNRNKLLQVSAKADQSFEVLNRCQSVDWENLQGLGVFEGWEILVFRCLVQVQLYNFETLHVLEAEVLPCIAHIYLNVITNDVFSFFRNVKKGFQACVVIPRTNHHL
jgi:hypothetical protein